MPFRMHHGRINYKTGREICVSSYLEIRNLRIAQKELIQFTFYLTHELVLA